MDYDIEQHTWGDVRERVSLVNQELAEIIDKISPNDNFKLYSVNYKYGQIIDDGSFYLPEKQSFHTVKITDAKLNKEIKSDLLYANGSIPAGIILNGAMEVFIDYSNKIIPRNMYHTGDVFALWRKLDNQLLSFHPLNLMKITAGARSLFMLSNIGDATYHTALHKKHSANYLAPRELKDQWNIFSQISSSLHDKNKWRLNILFFSMNWLDKISTKDEDWQKLKFFLMKTIYDKTSYARNECFVDFALSSTLYACNLKPNPYLLDTFRHILKIIAGETVGFSVAINDNLAPVKLIQDVYMSDYNMKGYFPVIFEPSYYNLGDIESKKSVYYSLQYPISYKFSPKSRNQATVFTNLRELQHLMTEVLKYISNDITQFKKTTLSQILDVCDINFYHPKKEVHHAVKNTFNLLDDDMYLKNIIKKTSEFCYNGNFIRGCIRLSNKFNGRG